MVSVYCYFTDLCVTWYIIFYVYKSPNSQPRKPDRPEESKYIEARGTLIQFSALGSLYFCSIVIVLGRDVEMRHTVRFHFQGFLRAV